MKMSLVKRAFCMVIACCLILICSVGYGAVLFQDTFDRADSRNIDASLTGITDNTGSSLAADGVYSQPHVDPVYESTGSDDGDAANGGGSDITGGHLRLAVGPGTSNAYVNHNFINNEILAAGGFTVSLDIADYGGTDRQHGGGFAIGMSQAEAASAGDAYSYTEGLNMTGAYNPDPYGITGQPVGPAIVSDFWIGIRGNKSLAWGSSTGDVLGVPANGLPEKTGSISVDFSLSDFNAGSTVDYEVFYNGESKGTGSFTWSETNANYIGLDGRSGAQVTLDDFSVTVVPEPAGFLLVLISSVALLGRRLV